MSHEWQGEGRNTVINNSDSSRTSEFKIKLLYIRLSTLIRWSIFHIMCHLNYGSFWQRMLWSLKLWPQKEIKQVHGQGPSSIKQLWNEMLWIKPPAFVRSGGKNTPKANSVFAVSYSFFIKCSFKTSYIGSCWINYSCREKDDWRAKSDMMRNRSDKNFANLISFFVRWNTDKPQVLFWDLLFKASSVLARLFRHKVTTSQERVCPTLTRSA